MNDKSDMIAIIWLFIHIVVAIDIWFVCWMMYDRLHTIIGTVIKKKTSPNRGTRIPMKPKHNLYIVLSCRSRAQVAAISQWVNIMKNIGHLIWSKWYANINVCLETFEKCQNCARMTIMCNVQNMFTPRERIVWRVLWSGQKVSCRISWQEEAILVVSH